MLLLWLSIVPSLLRAQIRVDLHLEQEQVLRDESLPVHVRITNLTGQPLSLGESSGWLRFDILDAEGAPVLPTGPLETMGEFTLQPSEVGVKRVDLTPGFKLPRPGTYRIYATVTSNQWAPTKTKPAKGQAINVLKLGEREFGVVSPAGLSEVRKLTLLQAPYQKRLRLYARISDASGHRTYTVYPLGTAVSFGKPELVIDHLSQAHILFQAEARRFDYCVLSPSGALVSRRVFSSLESRPWLIPTPEGEVTIHGGRELESPDSSVAATPR